MAFDVVVFDPATLLVLHIKQGKAERRVSPVEIALQRGCVVTV